MDFSPYYELVTRQGKVTSVLTLGIKRIETDNFGAPQGANSFFPRIFIYYLNDNFVKLDFENEAVAEAKKVYEDLKKISTDNMKYLVDNNMLEQVFNIKK